MQTLDRDELSIHVDASARELYALVSDVTRTPQFSPEVVACVWLDGATGPRVGARFEATNAVGRGKRWKNRPVVTVADPGREFAFARTEPLAGTVVWRYRFEPEAGGTRITESYEVTRPITRPRDDVRSGRRLPAPTTAPSRSTDVYGSVYCLHGCNQDAPGL
jgi:hypothetical protein